MARVHRQAIGSLDIISVVSGAPWKQNCHLVVERSTGHFLVVDPGADSPELRDAIREAGTRPAQIVVTHGHPDHIGAAAFLTDELDVDCLVARADQGILRHAPAFAAAFGRLRIRLPDRLRYIDPREEIQLGGIRLTIIEVPGHTPGSLAFGLGDAVLTGDTLLREHVGRTDLPGSDAAALARSVDRLLAGVPASTTILPGHGRPWNVGEARAWWVDRAGSRTSPAPQPDRRSPPEGETGDHGATSA